MNRMAPALTLPPAAPTDCFPAAFFCALGCFAGSSVPSSGAICGCSAVSAEASGPPGVAVRPASNSSRRAAADVAGAESPSSHSSFGSPCSRR